MPEEEQEGITEFFTNLFGGEPENATVTTTNTTSEDDGILDFFSNFIWDDEKNNKTVSANITVSAEIKPNE